MLMEKYIEMTRLNAVWNHPLYQKYYRENEKMEHDREFCCHQITHLLDVARIAYIKNLEAGALHAKEFNLQQQQFCMTLEKLCSIRTRFLTKLQVRRSQERF